MNLKRLGWVVLGCVVALSVAVWQLPATTALLLLPNSALNTPAFRLHAINGSVWRGAADFSTLATPRLLRLQWRCAPILLNAEIDCDLSGALQGNVRLQPFAQSARITKLSGVISVDASPNQAARVSSERLSLIVESADVSRSYLRMKGSLNALDVRIDSPVLTPNRAVLGNVSMDCTAEATSADTRCVLNNQGGENKLDGIITLNPRVARGSGTLQPPGGTPLNFNF